ncbi:STAS domain-containing protein [Solidesulfovibrio sp.]|uniref:STAS domain-containing protein n=1 Tax=Solidesulfovibrio sp. TaxID=2910990 RepID=UPI00261D8A2F|nr:STAS domain-containing protein [Solidesulfovibrio sp.]
MELSATLEGACLIVTVLVPEVDHTVSEAFKDAVILRYESAKARELLLDLGRVTFLDSKAIGAMVTMRKAAAARGGRLGVCNLHPHVEKIIRVVTLGTIFETYPDRETALERLCG